MNTHALILTTLFYASASQAQTYKCEVKYASGTTVRVNVSSPLQGEAKLIVLLGPNGRSELVGKGAGFVNQGRVEFNRIGGPYLDESPLIVTNREPFIAFFQDQYRAVSLRIDSSGSGRNLTYYDAWFAPSEVAVGPCN